MEKKDHETPNQSPRKQAWTMNPTDQALARNDAAYDQDYPKAMEAILSKNKIRNAHLRPRANLGNSATHASSPSVAGSETVTQEPADKLPEDDKDRSNLDAPETESQEQNLPSASDDKLPEDYRDHSALDAPETRPPLPLVRESSPHGTETDPNQIAKNDTFQLHKRDFHLPTGSKSTFFPRAETVTQEHNLPSASAGLGMSDQVWLDPEAEEACRRLLLQDENESRLPYFTVFCPADPQPERRAMSANCTEINNTFQPDKRDSKETVTQEQNLSSPFALLRNPTGVPANSPCTMSPAEAEPPVTHTPRSPPTPRQDSQQLEATGHAPAKNDTFEQDFPLLNREIPSKSSLRNAHVLSRAKTVTQEQNLSSASTRKGAMSAKSHCTKAPTESPVTHTPASPPTQRQDCQQLEAIGQAHDTFQPEKRDFEETVTQESDLPSAPDDKLPDDDEIA